MKITNGRKYKYAGTSNAGTSNVGTSNAGTSNAGTSNVGTNNAGTSNAGTSNKILSVCNKTSLYKDVASMKTKKRFASSKNTRKETLPLGWIRINKTGIVPKTTAQIEYEKRNAAIEKSKAIYEHATEMLFRRQKERDELNELLGPMSPYYDAWDITGPPGESEEEYSDFEEDLEE